MKREIKYLTYENPEVSVSIKEITDGVWFIHCSFDKRLSLEGYGGSSGGPEDDPDYESIYLGDGHQMLVEVRFFPPEEGHLFGEMSKREFHGFFLTGAVYKKIWEQEEVID